MVTMTFVESLSGFVLCRSLSTSPTSILFGKISHDVTPKACVFHVTVDSDLGFKALNTLVPSLIVHGYIFC